MKDPQKLATLRLYQQRRGAAINRILGAVRAGMGPTRIDLQLFERYDGLITTLIHRGV